MLEKSQMIQEEYEKKMQMIENKLNKFQLEPRGTGILAEIDRFLDQEKPLSFRASRKQLMRSQLIEQEVQNRLKERGLINDDDHKDGKFVYKNRRRKGKRETWFPPSRSEL